CTNGRKRISILLEVERGRIGTENVYFVASSKAGAKLLEPNGGVLSALRPQKSRGFTKNRNPRVCCLCRSRGRLNEIFEAFEKSVCVLPLIDHDRGNQIGSIQRNIGSLLDKSVGV